MLVAFRVPVIGVRCARCGARAALSGSAYGGKIEVDLPCKCPVPEPELAFYYPENHREPINTMRLEQGVDRRVREGNEAAAAP